jgi:hypothetical protein
MRGPTVVPDAPGGEHPGMPAQQLLQGTRRRSQFLRTKSGFLNVSNKKHRWLQRQVRKKSIASSILAELGETTWKSLPTDHGSLEWTGEGGRRSLRGHPEMGGLVIRGLMPSGSNKRRLVVVVIQLVGFLRYG